MDILPVLLPIATCHLTLILLQHRAAVHHVVQRMATRNLYHPLAEPATANQNHQHAVQAKAVQNLLHVVQVKVKPNQNHLHAVPHAEAAVINDFKSEADAKVKICILIFSVELCGISVSLCKFLIYSYTERHRGAQRNTKDFLDRLKLLFNIQPWNTLLFSGI